LQHLLDADQVDSRSDGFRLQQRLWLSSIAGSAQTMAANSFRQAALDTRSEGLCCKNMVEEALSVTTALLTPLKRDG
jgi:hypothetical protein